jgi:hypothetical protein
MSGLIGQNRGFKAACPLPSAPLGPVCCGEHRRQQPDSGLLERDKIQELTEQSLLHIVPTVLAYLDCSVPEAMDGELLETIFVDPMPVDLRKPTVPKNQP